MAVEGGAEPAVDAGVERLLGLLWLFRAEGIVHTTDEIETCGYPDVRHEGSAGRKNFHNDRERLASLGIELRRTEDGRWRVESIADALEAHLSDEERTALVEAELLVGASGGQGVAARRHAGPPQAALLLSAVADRHAVAFDYERTRRRVDPLRLSVSNQGRWYLHGVDTELDEERTYRVDRIGPAIAIDRSVHVAQPATEPSSVHPSTWHRDAAVEAEVRFAHEPLPEWLAMLGPSLPPTNEQRTHLRRRWRTTNHGAFVSRVLAIGPTAELVAPPELVSLLRATLRAHLDQWTA